MNTYEYVTQVFKNIALAKVATSAEEAKAFGYFRGTDGVSFDRARQLTEAKAAGARPGARRATTRRCRARTRSRARAASRRSRMMVDTLVAGGYASEHDAKIARKLATVLCGGVGGAAREVTEDEMLELEREAFVSLCGEPKSQERMQYMLMKDSSFETSHVVAPEGAREPRTKTLEFSIASSLRSGKPALAPVHSSS